VAHPRAPLLNRLRGPAHDAEAARKLMLAHLQDFEKRLRRYLRAKERAQARPRPPARSRLASLPDARKRRVG
jgi:hypothetical protein